MSDDRRQLGYMIRQDDMAPALRRQLFKRRDGIIEQAPPGRMRIDLLHLFGHPPSLWHLDPASREGPRQDGLQGVPPVLGRHDGRMRVLGCMPGKAGLEIEAQLVSRHFACWGFPMDDL
jgi:hypothetical protein